MILYGDYKISNPYITTRRSTLQKSIATLINKSKGNQMLKEDNVLAVWKPQMMSSGEVLDKIKSQFKYQKCILILFLFTIQID